MSGHGWLCSICSQSNATSFCSCGGRETFICVGCLSSHYIKAPTLPHRMLPVASFGQHKIPGYFERFETRSANFAIAKEEILKNIEEVNKCVAELSQGIDAIIAAVREFGNSQIAQLQNLRMKLERDIASAIAEAEKSICIDSLELENQLVNDILCYNGNPENLKFFSFRIDTSGVIEKLSEMCEFTLEEDLAKYELPGIRRNTLKLYNIKTLKSRGFSLSQAFSDGIRLCFISRNELLIVGSNPASIAAHTLNIAQTQISAIQPMQVARILPGLIVAENAAYVFGGDCKECEKYQLSEKQWKQLPNIRGRIYAFSPCRVENDIYLIDVSCANCDAFNLTSQQFRPLELSTKGLANNSLSVFANGEILIVTCNMQLGRLNLGETKVNVAPITGAGEHPISQCQPVFFAGEIYYVSWQSGDLNAVDIEAKTIEKVNLKA